MRLLVEFWGKSKTGVQRWTGGHASRPFQWRRPGHLVSSTLGDMHEIQETFVEEALRAVSKALEAGVDPDLLMDRIIQKAIEVVRGKERSTESSDARFAQGRWYTPHATQPL